MDSINDIISSLSSEDIEMLKGVASSIMGGASNDNQNSNNSGSANQNSNVSNGNNHSANPFSNLGINQSDINLILKAKAMFEQMNNNPSNNANLIMALKPHLSEENQQKADKAVRIMKIFEMLPLIKDFF